MKKVHIRWFYEIDFQEALVEGLKDYYTLYAILKVPKTKGIKTAVKAIFSDPELLYIGSSLQTPTKRLLSNHKALLSALRDFGDDNYVQFAFGGFSDEKDTSIDLDEQALRDVEAAIIQFFKPRLNATGVKDYVGSQALRIRSECEDISQLNFEIEAVGI